jgi:hypothetical protein
MDTVCHSHSNTCSNNLQQEIEAECEPPQGFLARLWPWSVIAFVSLPSISVEIAVLGYPLRWFFDADTTYGIQSASSYIMVALAPFSILNAVTYDIQQHQ